ncbi:fibronectin type III domain-containing protein [Candidatus Fermentibacteria bacterium]|nr:fibronectin type III domain-containing protein [Candidatus Fermentibacteria bacterium]
MTMSFALGLLVGVLAVGDPGEGRRSLTLTHRSPARDRPGLSGSEQLVPSPGGHFLVHFTTTGADATTAVYASEAAQWADTARQVFTGFGWLPPPGDGSGGGDSRYDVYLKGLGTDVSGYTQLEASIPGGYPDDATSFIVLATGMTGDEQSAAVAHHVHQACQYAYSANELGAWMEQSAGWIEELVAPGANRWALRTGSYLGNCHKYLYVSDGWTEHGALLWPKFLVDSGADADLIRRIWVRCAEVAGNNVVSATENELAASGRATLTEEYQVFTAWNYLCGIRDDGLHYAEGDLISGAVPMVASHGSYPSSGESGLAAPYGLGANYVEFLNDGGESLHISVDGSDAQGPWSAGVIAVHEGGSAYGLFGLDPSSGQGDTTLTGFSSLQRVILVVHNLRLFAGAQGQFSYAAEVVGSTPPTAPSGLTTEVMADWIRLSWNPSTDPDGDLAGYHVYRGAEAFLPTTAMTRIATAITDENSGMPGVQWTDQNTAGADVVGNVTTNYFWRVSAVDAAANESASSGMAGEFDYVAVLPGR